MVLGTAQFGMDYGVANVSGKPERHEVAGILDLAWENGIRHFDTAPGYGSEVFIGEFINANGLQDEAILLTKLPSFEGWASYETIIRTSVESSLKNLGCPIDVLFFHNAVDSVLLLKEPQFFESLLQEYPISDLGVSVYEPEEVLCLSNCPFDLSFQFPFNVLDRRFAQVGMPLGKRYARSIFLQGLLASTNGLRPDAPVELFKLQQDYHDKLADHHLSPIGTAVSFAACSDFVDYFLIGVDTEQQLQDILDLDSFIQKDVVMLDALQVNTAEKWLDPREWY